MNIIDIGGHQDMSGGYSNTYKVEFGKYGYTLKDVIKEIKEYTNNDDRFGYIGNGFGKKGSL